MLGDITETATNNGVIKRKGKKENINGLRNSVDRTKVSNINAL